MKNFLLISLYVLPIVYSSSFFTHFVFLFPKEKVEGELDEQVKRSQKISFKDP